MDRPLAEEAELERRRLIQGEAARRLDAWGVGAEWVECVHDGCETRAYARGRCRKHYLINRERELDDELEAGILVSRDRLVAAFSTELNNLYRASRVLETCYRRVDDEGMAELMAGIADVVLAEVDRLAHWRGFIRLLTTQVERKIEKSEEIDVERRAQPATAADGS